MARPGGGQPYPSAVPVAYGGGMGFYRDQILPRVVDKALGNAEIGRWRSRTTAGLTGEIVEIGFGSGLNVPVYPTDLTCVHAIDPATVGRKLAAQRVASSATTVTYAGLDGEVLPFADASLDGALCTFTLCTVPHPERALAELMRVVRPGGRFHLVEHGRSPEPSVARWQERIEPIQRRLFDGCHLSRDTVDLLTRAGFEIVDLEQRYVKGPKPLSYFTRAATIRP